MTSCPTTNVCRGKFEPRRIQEIRQESIGGFNQGDENVNPASISRSGSSPSGSVAVVGQGVIGLTSAIRLAEVGFRVTCFSRDDLNCSTSMSAGAYWWPHKLYPEHRVRRWAADSLQVYRQLSQSPDAGVRLEAHRRYCVDADDCGYARDLLDSWSPISGSSLDWIASMPTK